ncbi:MAG: LysR family transcriptional regulator [Parvibaculum sp.]
MARPNLSQLRVFNAVARHASFSAAAAELGISQPAVSAQIRSLEREHGAQLCERSRKGVTLTELGRELFRATQRLDDLLDESAQILGQSAALARGSLTVTAGAPNPAMALIARFRAAHPAVNLTVRFGDWNEVVQNVADRTADVGILTEAPGSEPFMRVPCAPLRLVALVPAGHPIAERAEISLSALSRERLILRTGTSITQRSLEGVARQAGIELTPALVLGSREAVFEAVAAGIGIGFAFDQASSRRDGLARVAIAEAAEPFEEYVFFAQSLAYRADIVELCRLAKDLRRASEPN